MRNVRERRREGNGSRRLPADQKVDDERRDAWCDERVAPSGRGRREGQQRHQRQLSVRASRCGGAGGESQTRPETVSDGGGDERHRCERARRRGGDRRGRRAADGRDELAGPARILLPEGHRQPDAVAGCDDESQHERRADDRPAARALFFVHGARSVCGLPGGAGEWNFAGSPAGAAERNGFLPSPEGLPGGTGAATMRLVRRLRDGLFRFDRAGRAATKGENEL